MITGENMLQARIQQRLAAKAAAATLTFPGTGGGQSWQPLPRSSGACPTMCQGMRGVGRAHDTLEEFNLWKRGREDKAIDNGASVLTPKSRQRETERELSMLANASMNMNAAAAAPTHLTSASTEMVVRMAPSVNATVNFQITPQQQHKSALVSRGNVATPPIDAPRGFLALAHQQHDSLALIATGAAVNDGLNHLQRQAATHDAASALIIFAPAGAGKTLTLVHRVLYLVGSGGLAPSQVLTLTFTRKAAVEVRHRLQRAAALDVEVSTFHGWCLRLIRTFAHLVGRKPDFRLASSTQQLGLLKEAVVAYQAQQSDFHSAELGGPQTPSLAREEPQTPGSRASCVMPSGLTMRRNNDATSALCKKLQRAINDGKLLGSAVSAQVRPSCSAMTRHAYLRT